MNTFKDYFTSSKHKGLFGGDLLSVARNEPGKASFLLGNYGDYEQYNQRLNRESNASLRSKANTFDTIASNAATAATVAAKPSAAFGANDMTNIQAVLNGFKLLYDDPNNDYNTLPTRIKTILDNKLTRLNHNTYAHTWDGADLVRGLTGMQQKGEDISGDVMNTLYAQEEDYKGVSDVIKNQATTDNMQRKELKDGMFKQNKTKQNKTKKSKKKKKNK